MYISRQNSNYITVLQVLDCLYDTIPILLNNSNNDRSSYSLKFKEEIELVMGDNAVQNFNALNESEFLFIIKFIIDDRSFFLNNSNKYVNVQLAKYCFFKILRINGFMMEYPTIVKPYNDFLDSFEKHNGCVLDVVGDGYKLNRDITEE